MATETKQKEAANPDDELVTVQLFRDNDKYQGDVFVAVNGQTCLIKRGVPVQIKRKFARVLEESMAQDNATADLISRETSKFQEESRARGIKDTAISLLRHGAASWLFPRPSPRRFHRKGSGSR